MVWMPSRINVLVRFLFLYFYIFIIFFDVSSVGAARRSAGLRHGYKGLADYLCNGELALEGRIPSMTFFGHELHFDLVDWQKKGQTYAWEER